MSLRTRLVLMQVGLTVLLLGGIWLRLGSSVTGWAEEVVDAALHARFDALAGRLEFEHGRLELEGDDDDGEASYRVSEDGQVRLTRGFSAYAMLDERPGYRTVTLPDGQVVRALTGDIELKHHRRLVLTVVRPTRTFTALSARLLRGILVTLAGGVLVGAIGAAVLAAFIVAPIRRLADQVSRLEAEGLQHRVAATSTDPSLVRLTETFNALLDRLQGKFDRQRAFVARASHALKTPLATVLAQAEVALHRERDAAAYRQALQDIAGSARDSTLVVEGLLAASRADAATEQLRCVPVQVGRLLSEVRQLFDSQVAQAGLTFITEGDAASTVFVDPDRLKELLAALLDNAVRYTPPGGQVGLSITPSAQGSRVVVWDTGFGISDDERDQVLERFFRGHAAEALGQPGSGLGLAVVAALAGAHHAALSLEPQPGGGTRVVLDFPGAP